MRGIGSHSCGPNPEECYELRPHEFKFAFVLSTKIDEISLLDLARTDFGEKTQKLSDTYIYQEQDRHTSVIECNINN